MDRKKIIWLGGVLVALLGVALLTGVFDGDVSTVEVPEVTIPADRIDGLRIERGEAPVALARQDGRWRLTEPVGADADSAEVARLLEQLGGLELASVVSTNPERYATYGVDSTAAALVVAHGGRERRLVVSDRGPDYRSRYVRLDDDPRVFATAGPLAVPSDVDRLRDRTVVRLRPSEVTAATVERPEGTFEVRHDDGGWTLVQDGAATPADSAAVARWLGRFARLEASGFLDVPAATVRDSSTHRLTFAMGADAPALWFWTRPGDTLAVAATGAAEALRLPGYQLDTYVPDPETLKRN